MYDVVLASRPVQLFDSACAPVLRLVGTTSAEQMTRHKYRVAGIRDTNAKRSSALEPLQDVLCISNSLQLEVQLHSLNSTLLLALCTALVPPTALVSLPAATLTTIATPTVATAAMLWADNLVFVSQGSTKT